jgi:hypothetical protein
LRGSITGQESASCGVKLGIPVVVKRFHEPPEVGFSELVSRIPASAWDERSIDELCVQTIVGGQEHEVPVEEGRVFCRWRILDVFGNLFDYRDRFANEQALVRRIPRGLSIHSGLFPVGNVLF